MEYSNKARRSRVVTKSVPLLAGVLLTSTGVGGAPLAASAASLTVQVAPPALGDLLTFGYGNTRSGHDPVGGRIGGRIGGLSGAPSWNDALDGAVYGEPLVYDATTYVATEDDSVYAIAASTGKVLWRAHVGTAPSLRVVDSAPTLSQSCGDIDPLGVTGTPVIDAATGELFVAEETMIPGPGNWQHVRHWMVAISLSTHRELWHHDIDPPHGNHAQTYYIPAEQQRPALTLGDGRVYATFGGLSNDCGQFHGYVVDVAESGAGGLQSYEVPTQREGAIWDPGGLLVSSSGNLYLATGNGSSNTVQDFDEGNAVVELTPALRRLGVWAPSNWVQLNDDDWDLGSSGPIEVPGTSLLFVAGKPASNASFGYLMSEAHLDGIGRGAYSGAVCTSGGAFGADASDVLGAGSTTRRLIYVPCGGGTVAVDVTSSPMRFHRAWVASTGSPNGSPVVAGGAVWALNWNSGQLYGMNAATGHVFVERPTAALPHFATPGVGDGRIFVPTLSGVEAFSTLS